ncbi:MAG: hypothetical protein NTV86_22030 [Planctomycetota bacterium]|nr:hypothetical protein [Planctomycetota bacterium]
MTRRDKTNENGTARRSFLTWLLDRVAARGAAGDSAPAHPEPSSFLETLEPRELLSISPMAAPDFLLYRGSGSAQPAATSSPTGMTPAAIRHAYGIDQTVFGTIAGDGTGQTIAVVDAYNAPNILADLHAFDLRFGLPDPPSLTKIGQTGTSTLPGRDPSGRGNSWAVETSLDVEWAHVVAPNAKIVLVEARSASYSDLFAAINTARHYTGVSVVSMSWGGVEFSGQSSYDTYFSTPAGHTGVTFVASSGDSGAYTSSSRMGVSYPAASPKVLSVGGTYLTVDAAGNYVSESGWGHGTNSYYYGGAGGGISSYVSQPSWQNGVVSQTATRRAVPDVAMDADPNSGVAVYDSYDFGTATPWLQVGGTSLAAPLWAGVISLVDQGRALAGKSTLDGATQTLPGLYGLPASDFHDVTTGNNGYPAGPGYDLVTGRGSPIVNLLVADLVGGVVVPPSSAPTIGSFSVTPGTVVSGSNTSITLTAGNILDAGNDVASVAFYRESNGTGGLQTAGDTLLGAGSLSGAAWTLTASTAGLTAGTYTYYAVATDKAALTSNPASTSLAVTAAAPLNNNFAAATVLTGTTASAAGSNVGATKESGEPNHAGNVGGKSVWYSWTAPAGGAVTVNTTGSTFDTLLAVYTGSSVSGLKAVAANDDAVPGFVLTSSVTFTAVAGTVYHIAVDGYNAASGAIAVNLSEALPAAAPANDSFANPVGLSGPTATWTGSNAGATRQSGEPNPAGVTGGASVWLTWTAPTTGTVSLNTHGSTFDTVLAVYTGSALTGLTSVAANDDDSANGTLTSAVTFTAVAGTLYHILVDGYHGATGTILLNLA